MDDAAFDILESAERLAPPTTLAAGTVLMREGTVGEEVYLLVSGSLSVSRTADGLTSLIATIDEPGSVIGEIAPMAGGARTATITATQTTRVVAMPNGQFHQLLDQFPKWAAELSAGAVRRAEEGELVELLRSHLGLTDPVVVAAVRGAAEWVKLAPGELLYAEGTEPHGVSIVIRGGLTATTWDEVESTEVVLGQVGRGQVVGDIGLLGPPDPTPRIVAVRSTVLARIPSATFEGLLDSHPRRVIEASLATRSQHWRPGGSLRPKAVLAVLVSERLDVRKVVSGLGAELARLGSVEQLWPERVDSLLGSAGIAAIPPQDPGDIRVGRLLNEAEMASDHLLLDVSRPTGFWAHRALAVADRVLVVVPPDPSDDELGRLQEILAASPPGIARSLVIMHPSGARAPVGTATLVDQLGCTEALHIRSDELRRLARTVVGRGLGLVLGGGGARGFAHLGVYRALRESGLEIDALAGTSIGSILAAAMADGPSPDDLVELARRRFGNVLDYTIPVVSLIRGNRIASALREEFGDRHIEDLWRPFACLSTDLTTSRSHIHARGRLDHALRASSSIPGVMPPVPHGDHLLVDGGVLNNLPVDILRRLTPDGVAVAVDVAPIRGPRARADFGLSVSGWRAARSRKGVGAPGISSVLMRSMIVASQRERDRQIAGGLADLYLELDLRGVSMLDFSDVAGVARRGYEAAMPRVTEWLESQHA